GRVIQRLEEPAGLGELLDAWFPPLPQYLRDRCQREGALQGLAGAAVPQPVVSPSYRTNRAQDSRRPRAAWHPGRSGTRPRRKASCTGEEGTVLLVCVVLLIAGD